MEFGADIVTESAEHSLHPESRRGQQTCKRYKVRLKNESVGFSPGRSPFFTDQLMALRFLL